MRLVPPDVSLPPTAPDDPRVGHLIGSALREGQAARVSILGFAVDQGVARNGGRPGACEGPRALREKLYRMTPDPRSFEAFRALLAHTRDLGDVEGSGDLERDQEALGEHVAEALSQGGLVVVLGGGHETSYGHFLGYVRAQRRIAIQNVDAHPDVRPLLQGRGHSGSPFRQALEHTSGACLSYAVHGLQPSAVAQSHLAYLIQHSARYGFRESFQADALYGPENEPTLATFCLDAVDQAYAPGVSAPSTDGLRPGEWLRTAFRAGASHNVSSVDVVELNPRLDRDGQTARLAARTVFEVLRGFLSRA